jgi:hypothetical protein
LRQNKKRTDFAVFITNTYIQVLFMANSALMHGDQRTITPRRSHELKKKFPRSVWPSGYGTVRRQSLSQNLSRKFTKSVSTTTKKKKPLKGRRINFPKVLCLKTYLRHWVMSSTDLTFKHVMNEPLPQTSSESYFTGNMLDLY